MKLDLEIDQGADFSMLLTLQDENGDRIDLTGFTFTGQLKREYEQTTPSGAFAFAIQDQGVPATLGQVLVSMSAANTSALPVFKPGTAISQKTRFVYDIISDSGSQIVRWLEGSAFVSPEVTT